MKFFGSTFFISILICSAAKARTEPNVCYEIFALPEAFSETDLALFQRPRTAIDVAQEIPIARRAVMVAAKDFGNARLEAATGTKDSEYLIPIVISLPVEEVFSVLARSSTPSPETSAALTQLHGVFIQLVELNPDLIPSLAQAQFSEFVNQLGRIKKLDRYIYTEDAVRLALSWVVSEITAPHFVVDDATSRFRQAYTNYLGVLTEQSQFQ